MCLERDREREGRGDGGIGMGGVNELILQVMLCYRNTYTYPYMNTCKLKHTIVETKFPSFDVSILAWLWHVTRHDMPPQSCPSEHLGRRGTPWSAEEMLDGQHQKVDIPAHARTAHKYLRQKRLEEDLC